MASQNNARPPSAHRDTGLRRAWLPALAALFSGIALLVAILVGIALTLALAVTAAAAVATFALILRRLPVDQRRQLLRQVAAGITGGLGATLAYDFTRYLLSVVDPSIYNPFEAVRAFGVLFLGAEGTSATIVGTGFHLLNGTMFGVSYCLLAGRDGRTSVRRALATGIGWGLFLESLQLAIYPGWLKVNFFAEFVAISAAGHVVYGTVLGLGCRSVLRRSLRSDADPSTTMNR